MDTPCDTPLDVEVTKRTDLAGAWGPLGLSNFSETLMLNLVSARRLTELILAEIGVMVPAGKISHYGSRCAKVAGIAPFEPFTWKGLRRVGDVLPDGKTVEQALKELDTSEDGVVSFDEFKAYLARDAIPEEAIEVPEVWPEEAKTEVSPAVSPGQSLESAMTEMSSLLGRPEEELIKEARRLSEEHWISQVDDLKHIDESDWPRLGMPLKLEKVLRQHLGKA
eukprot:symbB.v1.2.022306.t1/scaffold1973.1/size94122/10